MLVLNLPFKALMFLTLMRPSLVLFLVLWLKLVKDFLKVRCRLDRKSGSAGMPRPISYAVFCLKKKKKTDTGTYPRRPAVRVPPHGRQRPRGPRPPPRVTGLFAQ